MIPIQCQCGAKLKVPETIVGGPRPAACPKCKKVIRLAAAQLTRAEGEFTTRLIIEKGPARVGEQILLGGSEPIEVGKLSGKHVQLMGPLVSRAHCAIIPDVQTGLWSIKDLGSSNGTIVNGHRTVLQDLNDGDVLRVGDYDLKFVLGNAPAAEFVPATALEEVAEDGSAAPAAAPIVEADGEEIISAFDLEEALDEVEPVVEEVGLEAAGIEPLAALAPAEAAPSKSKPKQQQQQELQDDLYDVVEDDPKPVARRPAPSAIMPAPLPQKAKPGTAGAAIPALAEAKRFHTTGSGKPLNYATSETGEGGLKLLGDCDIDWVMKLRNASTLMVLGISVRVVKWFVLGRILRWAPEEVKEVVYQIVDLIVAIMDGIACYLLTWAEPNVREAIFWRLVRYALRFTTTVAVIGQFIVLVALFMDNLGLTIAGGLMFLFVIPQMAIFLFYLWRLSLRLPNTALAVNCLIVMVGMTVCLTMVVAMPVLAMMSSNAAGGGGPSGFACFSTVMAAIGLIVFYIWYLCLLSWFNKSFS